MDYYDLHTLLATTDFPASSNNAALRAAMLSQRFGAKFELIHVLDKRELNELQRLLGGNDETTKEHICSQTRKLLFQLTDEVDEELGEDASCHLAEGDIIKAIISQADSVNADLLIVGMKEPGTIQQKLFGTTTERLLSMAQCPVLTVKQSPHTSYQSVIIPIDFSSWSLDAIHLAQVVAPQAELVLLHAY